MPWPNPDPSSSSWNRCHFMNCEQREKITRIEIITPDIGTVARAICPEHRALIAGALMSDLEIMVTPASVYGAATVQGGTIWINTIADYWFGKRKMA